MHKKLINIFTTLILSAGISFAATADIGTQAGQFLKLGAGARAAGMGEAYTAICEDTAAVYFNPAGLNGAGNFGISLMHAIWIEGVSYEWAGWNYGLGSLGKIGIGVQYVSYGSIIETDSTGFETGSFTPSDLSASLSYAKSIGGLDLGVTARYISMTVKQSATAITFDAGIMFKPVNQEETKLVVGFAASNLGSGVNFGSLAEQLASSYKLGLGYYPSKSLVFSFDACLPSDNALYFAAGLEYTYNLGRDPEIRFRAGYNTRNNLAGGISGLTVGLGFGDREYAVDYAFVPFGLLGNAHRISFSLGFGRGEYSRFEPVAPPEIKKSFEIKENKISGNQAGSGSPLTEKVKGFIAPKQEATAETTAPVVNKAVQKIAAPVLPKTEAKKEETLQEKNERIKKLLLKFKEPPKEQKPASAVAPVKTETLQEKNERIKKLLQKQNEKPAEKKPVTAEKTAPVANQAPAVPVKVETLDEKNERIKKLLQKQPEKPVEKKESTAETKAPEPKKEAVELPKKPDMSKGETLEEKNKRLKALFNKKSSEAVEPKAAPASEESAEEEEDVPPAKKETIDQKNQRIRDEIRKSLSGK